MRCRNSWAAVSECWSASTMLPPASARNADARDDSGPVWALEQEHRTHYEFIGFARSSKEGEIGVEIAAKALEVDLDPGHTFAFGVYLGLGLDHLRDEHARGRGESRV